MKIDDEIKSKFSSEFHRASVNLIFTYNWMNGMYTRAMKKFGISSQQYNVLRILKGQHPNPASVKLIAERMLDKNSNASRLIDKLLDKKLVERRSCPNDRRQVEVLITNKGLALLEEATQVSDELYPQKNLTEEEFKQLSSLLDKFRG